MGSENLEIVSKPKICPHAVYEKGTIKLEEPVTSLLLVRPVPQSNIRVPKQIYSNDTITRGSNNRLKLKSQFWTEIINNRSRQIVNLH